MKNIHLEPLGNGISIFVSDSYHFSTDTILLANFSEPKGRKKCVELGTGCCTIPLLWCRNNKSAEITAVEIQKDACTLSQKSIDYNSLNNQIRLVNEDLKDLKGKLSFGSFDVVVCNPPYKISGGGIKNPQSSKEIARHEVDCTVEDVCETASKLLQFGGKLFMCQRPERLADVTEAMRKFSIEPKTLRLVQQRKDKAPKLFLIEGRRGGKRGFLNVLPTLFIEDENGNLSQEMTEIYGSYKEDYKLNVR